MRTRLVYLRLELKRAARFLPMIAGGAIALAALLGAVAFLAVQAMTGGREVSGILVGVVLPKEDALARRAVDLIGTMDSVESACEMVYVSREEGEQGLRDGSLDCLMVVPGDFVGSIMDGTNEPAAILFDGPLSVEERIFQELTMAGARILSSAQAGIYAADRLCYLYQVPEETAGAEAYLNREYLSCSLDRSAFFRKRQTSAFGEVPPEYHYGASGLVFLLLLTGIPAAGLFGGERPSRTEALRLLGVGNVWQTVCQTLAMTALLLVAVGTVVLGAWILGCLPWPGGGDNPLRGVFWETAGVLAEKSRGTGLYRILLGGSAAFAAGACVVFCYRVLGTRLGGMMALSGLTAGMMTISGGLLPEVFLPESFQRISPFLPTTILMDGVKRFFLSEPDWKALGALLFLGILAMAGAALGKGGRA